MTDTWITPRVWTAGERVGQSKMNELSNNFRSLYPYTTAGDLAYRSGDGNYLARLAKPAQASLLKMESGGVPSWAALDDFAWGQISLVRRTTTLTMENNTEYVIDWNSDISDPLDWHSGVTNISRITVGATGVYLAQVFWSRNTITGGSIAYDETQILLNGTEVMRCRDWAEESGFQRYNVVSFPAMTASAGQYFEVKLLQRCGTARILANEARFCILRVR